jgi:predicted porin
MELRKTQLAAAVGAALFVGATAVQAQNLQVQLYGQVSRALMFADDGQQSKWFNVDAQPSSTRFGIQGSAQATPGLRVGARIESEMKSNPSDTVSFADPSTGAVAGTVLFAERWLDTFFEGSWGRINLGQGSGAADDASTIDLSGTGMANGNCVCDWGGGIAFRGSASGVPSGSIGGPTVLGVFNNNDFESRYDRVMYTTPTFNGFRGQVGYGQKTDAGEVVEASLWWSGKLAGDIQAAIGWSNEALGGNNQAGPGLPATPDNETVGGSVSWLHTSGFNVTFAYTSMKIGGTAGLCGASGGTAVCAPGATGEADEVKFMWGKVGYKFGPHAIAVDYAKVDDQAAAGDEGTSYGVGYVWNPIRWLELFANYRIYQLDRSSALFPGVNFDDVTVAAVGTRIRF